MLSKKIFLLVLCISKYLVTSAAMATLFSVCGTYSPIKCSKIVEYHSRNILVQCFIEPDEDLMGNLCHWECCSMEIFSLQFEAVL